jgi:hypothetical protein
MVPLETTAMADEMGTRCGVLNRDQDRGCPRNCERRVMPLLPLIRKDREGGLSEDPRVRKPAIRSAWNSQTI